MSPRRAIPEKKKQGGLPSWLIMAGVAGHRRDRGGDRRRLCLQGPVCRRATDDRYHEYRRTKGDPKAPVAFVEFSDFR